MVFTNNKKEIDVLIDIIDRRIRKIIKEQNICYRYVAKVTSLPSDSTGAIGERIGIKILGFTSEEDAEYTMKNYSSVTLKIGDMVFIDTIGGGMNSGVISQVYNIS